jgi:hypothetical protein
MGIGDDELPMLMSRFPTPFTLVDRRWKNIPKTAISAIFRDSDAACRREGSLGNTLQRHEIGHDPCSAGPSRNRVHIGAPKLPHRFPLIVHYPMLLTMAPERHEFTLRGRTRFQRLKSHARASISLLPAVPLFEPGRVTCNSIFIAS